MSEKDREIKEVEEEDILYHWRHEHPLTLVETRREDFCYGCFGNFRRGEQGYGCSRRCGYGKLLHQECAEMPRKIRHAMHSEHILIIIQEDNLGVHEECTVCKTYVSGIWYRCTSLGCMFKMHMRCVRNSGVMDAVDDDDDEQKCTINHPNPLKHELRLLRMKSSFKCSACGVIRKGSSYICTSCEYWIHERCALLPQIMKREDHHHSLTLSYRVPPEYLKYEYKCEACNKFLMFKYWIYHCELCRYAVHIECAFKIKTTIKNKAIMDEKDIILLPTDDVAEELIRPFVMRQGGEGITPAIPPPLHDDDDEMVNVKKYKFILHEHELTLISTSPSHHHHHHHQKEKGEEEEEEEEDSDEYEEDWGKRSELICDGCISPILPSSSFSSSSDKSSSYYYMSCSECKYNLHLACFNLPPRLPSLPLFHNKAEHELVLISCPKHKPWKCWEGFYCSLCYLCTNGLMYGCSKCRFKADVKCASLPQTIHHAAHPQQLLNLLTPHDIESNNLSWRMCAAACGSRLKYYNFCYASGDGSYEFAVCIRCAVLPATVRSRRWDRHHPRLPLTYDANLNHPGEFYCDECETKMNPKSWMYHCRLCDLSFHPDCFKLTSGFYKNIKFEQEYSTPTAHPHTLTYQLLTTKRRCDTCGGNRYGWSGFLCTSCNFFICFFHPIDCTNI